MLPVVTYKRKRLHEKDCSLDIEERNFMQDIQELAEIDQNLILSMKYFTNGQSILHYATERRYKNATRMLLKYKADPNVCDDDNTCPLITAIRDDDVTLTRMLLLAKANVNVCDRHGVSALELCNQQPAILRQLLDSKADTQTRKIGLNATMDASPACLRLLIKAGININDICTENNLTPLAYACAMSQLENVQILCEEGSADIGFRFHGQTALHVCVRKGNNTILRYLLQKGYLLTKASVLS
jgi:ankyrin repeat protein